jgi:predicted dienelactone hydrolase
MHQHVAFVYPAELKLNCKKLQLTSPSPHCYADIFRQIHHLRAIFLMIRILFASFLASFTVAATAQDGVVTSATGFAGLRPGPLAVGWNLVQQYDYARAYKGLIDPVSGEATRGERARPIQTQVWYPARKGGTPITYADYVRTEASEEDFTRSPGEIEAALTAAREDAARRIGAAQADKFFGQRMWAVRDAAALPGTYPVVIYAPGSGGSGHEPADLGEYLASRGYVVIASRSLGTHARQIEESSDNIDAQMRDIEFLISYAKGLPYADMNHVAVVGWSWGGMTNVFAAERDSRIRALVSFDGTREPEYTKQISPYRVTVPWLYIQRRPETVAELSHKGIDTSFSLLNALKYADVYQVTMNPMKHVDFSSDALRKEGPGYFDEYSRTEVEQAYHWTARYVLEFLNATLKNDASARAFLDRKPIDNGVPRHMATIQHAAAQSGPLPTREGFAEALRRRGFAHAADIYRELRARDPAFVLSETEINLWGYGLMAKSGGLDDATAMFKFGTSLYPDSFNLFDSLGEAQENKRDIAAAITSYRRSLELNPKNANATAHLAVLTANQSAAASSP